MDKAIIAFLDRGSLDAQDLIAKRSIRALVKLSALRQNAYDRGLGIAHHHCTRALDGVIFIFAGINTAKNYSFADKVHPHIADMTRALDHLANPAEDAEEVLDQARAVIEAYEDVLTPVCTIHGISSVAILRGDHAEAAMAGVHIANDH
jgi:hypothetical protein